MKEVASFVERVSLQSRRSRKVRMLTVQFLISVN